jgi:membrane-associated protein
MFEFLHTLHSSEGLTTLIQNGGLVVLTLIVFAETGLLVGFFLPGDSLLITAGILSSPNAVGGGLFAPWQLAVCLSLAAVAGDQLNFFLGYKSGAFAINRPDGRLIKRRYFDEANVFYETHGSKAIVLARFMPILRTFTPFIAGFARMRYRRFVAFSIFGGLLWVNALIATGYYLGQTPWAKKLHEVILIVVLVSLLPILIGVIKRYLRRVS